MPCSGCLEAWRRQQAIKKVEIEFETIKENYIIATKPLNGSIVCPKCGSPNVTITPAVAWHVTGNWPMRYEKSTIVCNCGEISYLTKEQIIALAAHVFTKSDFFGFWVESGMAEELRRLGVIQETCKHHSKDVFCELGNTSCSGGACLKYEDREPLNPCQPQQRRNQG